MPSKCHAAKVVSTALHPRFDMNYSTINKQTMLTVWRAGKLILSCHAVSVFVIITLNVNAR